MRLLARAARAAIFALLVATAAEAQNTARTVTTVYGHQPMTGFVGPGDRMAQTNQALTERQIRKGSEGNGTRVGGDLNVTHNTRIDRQSNVATIGNQKNQSVSVDGDGNAIRLRGGKQDQDGAVTTKIGANQPGDLNVFGLPAPPAPPSGSPHHSKKKGG